MKLLQKFPGISHLMLLTLTDLFLEMLSNFKYYFGFVAEEIFDVGLLVL